MKISGYKQILRSKGKGKQETKPNQAKANQTGDVSGKRLLYVGFPHGGK